MTFSLRKTCPSRRRAFSQARFASMPACGFFERIRQQRCSVSMFSSVRSTKQGFSSAEMSFFWKETILFFSETEKSDRSERRESLQFRQKIKREGIRLFFGRVPTAVRIYSCSLARLLLNLIFCSSPAPCDAAAQKGKDGKHNTQSNSVRCHGIGKLDVFVGGKHGGNIIRELPEIFERDFVLGKVRRRIRTVMPFFPTFPRSARGTPRPDQTCFPYNREFL